MSDSQRVSDVYPNKQTFANILEVATEKATNAWEEEFVESIREKWEQFGSEMFLSDTQDAKLRNIAGK